MERMKERKEESKKRKERQIQDNNIASATDTGYPNIRFYSRFLLSYLGNRGNATIFYTWVSVEVHVNYGALLRFFCAFAYLDWGNPLIMDIRGETENLACWLRKCETRH